MLAIGQHSYKQGQARAYTGNIYALMAILLLQLLVCKESFPSWGQFWGRKQAYPAFNFSDITCLSKGSADHEVCAKC